MNEEEEEEEEEDLFHITPITDIEYI